MRSKHYRILIYKKKWKIKKSYRETAVLLRYQDIVLEAVKRSAISRTKYVLAKELDNAEWPLNYFSELDSTFRAVVEFDQDRDFSSEKFKNVTD